MSVPPAARRKTSDAGLTDKSSSDKNKHGSGQNGVKNGTQGKIQTPGRQNTFKKATSVEHTGVRSKSDAKKHTSTDNHTKNAHAAGNIYKASPGSKFFFFSNNFCPYTFILYRTFVYY